MNKVIAVNLNGAAYQVEEAGYDTLRGYLESASRRLESNPDRAEIMADIEQAIADKFRALLTAHKNVVTTDEVTRIVTEMGPVEDGSSTPPPEPGLAAAAPEAAAAAAAATPGVKRFYRLEAGAMIAGVCNGAAAYLNLDATVVRAIYVLITLLSLVGSHPVWSVLFWAMVYTALAIIIPKAQTPVEQAAAHGGHDAPRTAQEFIKRARAGYYEGMKTWQDQAARREWKRKFRNDMRGWRHHFTREMRRQGDHISGQWQQHGWTAPGISTAAWIVLPMVALLRIVLIGLWILAVFSVINTGTAFGHPMLTTMPFWKAMVVLAVIYFVLSLPLRMLRGAVVGYRYHRFHYGQSARGPVLGLMGICNGLVWVGSFALVTWLFVHHPTEAGRAFGELSAEVQKGVAAVMEWFKAG